MAGFFDNLETRSDDAREADLVSALPQQIARAGLADVEAKAITSRGALAKLPVLRKSELSKAQA
ncbi:MAG: phenylacetate-CoA ligase, partial [Paracoccaceae bacterium]